MTGSQRQPGHSLTLAAAAWVVGCAAVASAAPPVKAPKPPSALRVPTARLIRDLEHREYSVRRKAMKALIGRGRLAIPALARAARTAGPETAARVGNVLERLYANPGTDESTVEAAENALEALRESGPPVASRVSSQALEGHADLREKRAIAAIERLGGIVKYVPPQFQQPGFNQPGTSRQINFVLIGRKWRGGDTGLKYVKRLNSLRNIYVTQNKKFQPISEKALTALQRDMPNISVQKRGLACLGVSGSVNGGAGGCYVTLVERGSAAAKANLRAGDTIVEIAGKKIRDFHGLVDSIKNRDPGEKVNMVLLRAGRRRSVTVELAEWKP